MDFYQINDLERLSGIKAHTIRIWEKRYNIIMPQRTDTNIRYYNDAQLKKLLNVASLSNHGLKISKIAELNDQQLKNEIKSIFSSQNIEEQQGIYINEFIIAMIDFDEQKFDNLFCDIIEKYTAELAIPKIIYPFLHSIGILWRIDKTMPIEEHFASMLVKRKVLSLTESLPKLPNTTKTILLFLPAGEWHEIALLFAEYLIRKNGLNTINLGQNVPFSDIEFVIRKKQPQYLLSFIISEKNESYFLKINDLLKSDFPKTVCLLSGNNELLINRKEKKNLKLLFHPQDILKFL